MEDVVFLTGGTGFIGANLIKELLTARHHARVIALVRGASRDEARTRLLSVLERTAPACSAQFLDGRLMALPGDICLPNLGLDPADYDHVAGTATHFIHSAATVEFDTPLDEARRVNVEGTREVLAVAHAALDRGRLRRVGYIGTAYVSGLRTGSIGEHELQDGGFSNAYEQSKFEAECLVRRTMRELPLVILRPSIVVGDSETGATTSFNVLYPPLDWIRRRRISALPGFHGTPVDIVPVDYVSRAVTHLVLQARQVTGSTFHIAAGHRRSWTAGDVIDRAVEYFNRSEEANRIPAVRFIPPPVYRELLGRMKSVGERLQKMVSLYEPYLSLSRLFDTTNTTRALCHTGIAPPHPCEYFERLLDYCLASNWGRIPARAAWQEAA
jgi:long-chain acyl-CoA synthetase